MEYYQKIGYEYEYPLSSFKYFIILCLGTFFGGFCGGLFVTASSATIIFALVQLGVETVVTSAIVGYQVIFSAAVSLVQAYGNGKISL